MAVSSEVFRSNDLTANTSRSLPVFHGSRIDTASGYRFGKLSASSFFARHNPHPSRVSHLKGLLDIPICAVNDAGFFANPRLSASSFPPDNFNQNRIKQNNFGKVPVNTVGINSQKYPTNVFTGLQWFMGKPLNFRIFREKAKKNIGLVPETDRWREELRALTEAIGLLQPRATTGPAVQPPATAPAAGRPEPPTSRGSRYSATSGRLIPPPSRASRASTRLGSRTAGGGLHDTLIRTDPQLEHLSEHPDLEAMVMQMLCQILQTDDLSAVKAWLVSAPEREKSALLEMIKSALNSNEEYEKRQNESEATKVNPEDYAEYGKVIGSADQNNIDRLTLDDNPVHAEIKDVLPPLNTGGMTNNDIDEVQYTSRQISCSRQSQRSVRAVSNAQSLTSDNKNNVKSPAATQNEPKLRYSVTPLSKVRTPSRTASLIDEQKMWNPSASEVYVN